MRKLGWIALVAFMACPLASAHATGWRNDGSELNLINVDLTGKIVDYTANHGKDNRIWSRSLWQRRDLYVYLPPGYNPRQRYPLMIWLHGFHQDERSFVRHVAPALDRAIRDGRLPPLIVAAPDGTFKGEPRALKGDSFFLNSPKGDYADFVLQDVWGFVCHRYPIRYERQAHVLAGVSMGGFAAYNFAIKHRAAFGSVIGIMPPLNMRWMTKHGFYHLNFNPHDWAWKNDISPPNHILSLAKGRKTSSLHHWIEMLYRSHDAPIADVARENPIEMITNYGVQPGQLDMYVAYTEKDEFNIDAQVESFLYMARFRGLRVAVGYDPHGRHNMLTTERFLPGALRWLAPRIAPYSPVVPVEQSNYLCPVSYSCPPGCCPPSPVRQRLRRLGVLDNDSCGYPHTLPDPKSCKSCR